MDHRAALIGLVLALSASQAHAFAYPEPPGGVGGGNGGWTWRPPAPSSHTGGRVGLPGGGGASIGGRIISKPWGIAIRPAATAVIGRALAGGAIGLGLGLAEWAADNCVHKTSQGWTIHCGPNPEDPLPPGVWIADRDWSNPNAETFSNGEDACRHDGALQQGADIKGPIYGSRISTTGISNVVELGQGSVMCSVSFHNEDAKSDYTFGGYRGAFRADGCPAGRVRRGTECVIDAKVTTATPDEIAKQLETAPLPDVLPPGIDLPIEAPVWNPGRDGRTMPVRVPMGEPITDPNTGETRQPAVEVSQSKDDPLKLETTPVDVPVNKPGDKLDEPTDVKPKPDGSGTGNGGGRPTETDTTPLCEEFPDIVACQKLGELEGRDVKNRDIKLSLTPDASFSRTGSCPAPRTITVMGRTYQVSMTALCEFAQGIRPLLIGFAAITAVLTFLGVARRNS